MLEHFPVVCVTVSLENVLGDIQELQKGMEITRKEYELRKDVKDEKQNVILKDFLTNAEEKLRRLRADSKAAQDAFNECVEYFGERQSDANAFFGLFARFIKTYKVFTIFQAYLQMCVCCEMKMFI